MFFFRTRPPHRQTAVDARLRRGLALLFTSALLGRSADAQSGARLRGHVRIDGSSTVEPIMGAAAELFGDVHPRVRVTVGKSGTGGGFKKFTDDRHDLRIDIAAASRPIKPAELERAKKVGQAFVELPVAYDGLAVVVHPSNDFCDDLTIDELKRIWAPGSSVNNWKDVRRGFPDRPLRLYGPGHDSGTFDYFVETVVGKARASRSDYMQSEDDHVLVQGVAGDPGALGYFGFAYYEENRERLKALAIDSGDGTRVAPSVEAIRTNRYHPLSRPLLIYVGADAAARPDVRAFVQYFFTHAPQIVEHPRVGYVALPAEIYEAAWRRFDQRVTGSLFSAPGAASKPLVDLYLRPGLQVK
ncbi:Phosphate-binding protein PstS precursor [Phycisphaerae bacterium RAS1]|nr:Phosphate-binding protein PstS precursor [Phycisphaerae bacterium RAS1]